MSDVSDRLNAALEGRYRVECEIGEGGGGYAGGGVGILGQSPTAPDGFLPDCLKQVCECRLPSRVRV